MLINFLVKNFKSIKDEIEFSMEPANAIKNHPDSIVEIEKIKLLKTAVIYGPNGSGKSNLLLAMNRMRALVTSSVKEGIYKGMGNTSFKFSQLTKAKPTKFETTFLSNDETIYRYGFEYNENEIISEWLFRKFNKNKSREVPLFDRKGQEIENFSDFKKEGNLLVKEDKIRPDALYISVSKSFNGKIATEVFNWFTKFDSFTSHSNFYRDVTFKMLEENKSKILNLLKCADFGIADINFSNLDFEQFKDSLPKELSKEQIEKIKEENIIEIEMLHQKFDVNNEYVGLEKLDLHEESDGTIKFFELSGPIIRAIENNEILVVDELDNSFHTMMTREIIKLFHSSVNSKAQLIFSTHDTSLLNQELFRRDEVWFTEKDLYGATNLFSLYDFGTRKDTSLEKNYLNGSYGAIPYLQQLGF